MRFLAFAAWVTGLVLLPSLALSDTYRNWSNVDDWEGPAAVVCSHKYGPCLFLSCAAGQPVHLWARTDSEDVARVDLAVDGVPTVQLNMNSPETPKPSLFDSLRLEQTVRKLAAGRSAQMRFSNGKRFNLTLRGSSAAISKTLKDCGAQARAFASGFDSFGGRFGRDANEDRLGFPPEKQEYEFTRYNNLDIYGGDLRSALEDGYLVNMTRNQCEALCSVTQDCLYYTHNRKVNACFIKSSVPRTARYNGAVSAEFKGRRHNLRPPATSGRGTVVMKDAGWREGDTLRNWLERRKTQAATLGGNCGNAQAAGARVAETLRLDLSGGEAFGVGKPATVSWSGLDLQERLPIWLMISSDKPMRFTGQTVIALAPGAPNPFGMAHEADKHRALVALFSRGAGRSGSIEATPLLEGNAEISASLVQFVRKCTETVVMPLLRENLTAAPGPAQLVLNNDLGNRTLTHEIELEKHDRIVRLNKDRFLILDRGNGTEILQRAGSQLTVSPTHRFIAVTHGPNTEIVDVLDGATVARVDGDGALYWGLNDSFAMSTLSPWGEVNLAGLFGRGTFLSEQVTGPSCCLAAPTSTRVGIDLENASFSVWGRLGHAVGSLQFPQYAHKDAPRGGYSADKFGSLALFQHIHNSLGTVAPVSLTFGFDIAGGWAAGVNYYKDWTETPDGDQAPATFGEKLSSKLREVGLSAVRIGQPLAKIPSLDIANQFSRLGISLAKMEDGEVVYDGNMPEIPEALTRDAQGNYVPGGKQNALVLADLVAPLGEAARDAGWTFDWSDNIEIPYQTTECYHVDLGQSEHADKHLMLVRDIGWLTRLNAGKAPFFVTQAWCTAGATLGSLRPTTAIYFHDFAGPVPRVSTDVPMASAFFFENDPSELWYDHPFSLKGNKDLVLLIARGNGAVAVFSRPEGRIVHTFDNLPDGDLLRDAFLTEDLSHLVQVNSDGSLHLFRVKDGARVLSGRVVDDEIALWTEDFHFDATAEAAALIDLKFPGKAAQFSLDRFRSARRIEDLARKVLAGAQPPSLPQTQIPPEIAGDIRQEGSDILARISNAEGRVQKISVFQDGVLTNVANADGREQEIRVPRLPGARWVSVIGEDDAGLASLPVTRDLGPDPEGAPRQRALVLGVNTYNDADIPSLNYALRDGGRFAETLAGGLGDAPDFEAIEFLKDRRATPAAILEKTRSLLEGLGPQDHLVIFLAGHGLTDADGGFYFATSDTTLSDIGATALPFAALSALFEETPARVTVLIDACHSGAVGTGAFATSDQAVSGLAGAKSNITILAASKGRQFSQETAEVGGGVFTYALEKVLGSEREKHDRNGNGRLEASEVYGGVKDVVTAISAGNQTPWIVRSRMVGEYALF